MTKRLREVEDIPTIAMNTFKGGVSKTTTTYNLAWCLASEFGIKVMVVDLDPQRNLTQIFLESEQISQDTKDTIFRDEPTDKRLVSIGEALTACLDNPSLPNIGVETVQHPHCPNLYLLPGSLAVTDYEEELASSELSNQTATRYVAGVLNKVVQTTAQALGVQLIILDTSPSMGCLNMLVVMTSQYFVVPCQTDFYSLKAVELLRKRLFEIRVGDKGTWLERVERLVKRTSTTDYPLNVVRPKFLGVILQMFTVRKGKIVHAHRVFVDKVKSEVTERLEPALRDEKMSFTLEQNAAAGLHNPFIIAKIRNFNRFAPMAQEQGYPVYALHQDPSRLVQVNEQGVSSVLKGVLLNTAKEEVAKLIEPIKAGAKAILRLIQLPGKYFSFA